jgi:GNAT superfamily N-acetyltransferase
MSAELVGRRVVLRRRAGERDGRPLFSDVLGELIESGDRLVVRRANGEIVSVPSAEVHRLKPIPPGRAEIFALEEVAAVGWPAPETARWGGWLLRAAEGWTRRANSALLLGDPGRPVEDALERVRAWYVERGLTPRLAIPLPPMAPADHAAGRLGWAADVDVEVLTAPVEPTTPDPGVILEDTPSPEWCEVYAARTVPAVGVRVLTAPDTVTFGSIVDGGTTVAIGRGVINAGWLGVAAMEVRPEYRRQGLAARILNALLAWGAERGATRCYLQVEATNAAALALYGRHGFTGHHRYRTRYFIG